ncbi:MAG: carbon storage regulator [Oscillospiraceae bacterium]|nr:carbon storage regulator [Oscillospiraceae bacterium]
MLVLSRKKGEGVVIGDNISITVIELSNDRIRLGIDAPPEIRIARSELYYTEKFNIQAAVNRPATGLIKDIIAGNTAFKK